MISFMADVIGIRDDMYIGKGDATWPRSPSLSSRPTRMAFWITVPRSSPCSPIPTTPTQSSADMLYLINEFGGLENLKGKKVAVTWAYSPLTASRCPARSR